MKFHFPWTEKSEIGESVAQRSHERVRAGDWDHTAQHNLNEAREVLEEERGGLGDGGVDPGGETIAAHDLEGAAAEVLS